MKSQREDYSCVILIDHYSVYYFEIQIKDADPDTFECIIDFSKIFSLIVGKV